MDALNLKGLFENSLKVSHAAGISLMESYKSPFMACDLAFVIYEKSLSAAG